MQDREQQMERRFKLWPYPMASFGRLQEPQNGLPTGSQTGVFKLQSAASVSIELASAQAEVNDPTIRRLLLHESRVKRLRVCWLFFSTLGARQLLGDYCSTTAQFARSQAMLTYHRASSVTLLSGTPA